jgi:hypothetical protein
MKKTTLALGLGALALGLGVIGTSVNKAFAYRGDPAVQGPNYTAERHADMTKAFETNDYEAWKSLMAGKGRVTQVVNKDNFAKFAEAHELAEQGKTEEAQKIRQELGLGLHDGSGRASGGMGRGRNAN